MCFLVFRQFQLIRLHILSQIDLLLDLDTAVPSRLFCLSDAGGFHGRLQFFRTFFDFSFFQDMADLPLQVPSVQYCREDLLPLADIRHGFELGIVRERELIVRVLRPLCDEFRIQLCDLHPVADRGL